MRSFNVIGGAVLAAAFTVGALTPAPAQAQMVDDAPVIKVQQNPLFRRVAGWSILVARNRGNGCYMHRQFPNRQVVRMGVDQNKRNFYLSFYDRNWRSIRRGQNYRIQATFNSNRGSLANGSATGASLGSIPGLTLEGLKIQYVQRFAASRSMQIYYRNNFLGSFNLSGTRAALDVLIQCQRAYRRGGRDPFARGGGGRTNDPFAGGGGGRTNDPFSGGGTRPVSPNRGNDPFY